MAASKKQRGAGEAARGKREVAQALAVETPGWKVWQIGLLLAASLVLVIELYGPALNGPFLLDDIYQFFGRPDVATLKLEQWLNNVRPLLNLSFYVNYVISGTETSSYHMVNVLLHWMNALLCFFILRRLLRAVAGPGAGWRGELAPLAAAAFFLVHPVQTESVAYVSSRSELLSVLLAYAALAVFVSRPQPAIGWARAGIVIVLFGLGVLTKEHVAALPAVLLLADLFFHPEGPVAGVKANWRLYAPLAIAGGLGFSFVWKTLSGTTSAGFAMRDMSWSDYLFTQWRMFWTYLLLVVFPAGQNVDADVAISRTPFEHGAMIGGIAIVALLGAAFVLRKRYPLASFGILTFVILIAPTTSFVPIRDVFAERRLYLPMIGLLCVIVEGLRRVDMRSTAAVGAIAAVLVLLSALTWQRAHVWSSALALWEDSVAKSPNKYRPRFQYAFALYHEQRCTEAAEQYAKVAEIDHRPGERILVDWALALDCAGRLDEAAQKLEMAMKGHPTAVVFTNLAMIYGKTGRNDAALAVLARAEQTNPEFAQIYAFRGNIYFSMQKPREAAAEYRKALRLDPANQAAMHGLRALSGQ